MKTLLIDAVNTFVLPQQGINEDMFALLEKYTNKKIIVTNADDNQIIEFGMENLPYELFTLKHNPEKTDPSYFKTLLDHFDFMASEVIYFEHNLEAVNSARTLGINTFHYEKDKKDLQSLEEFLNTHL